MSHYNFHYPLRVRWAEVDRQGIVFNGHYLTYFDVGITELGCSSRGLLLSSKGLSPAMAGHSRPFY
jgi:acyl-CoA thioesterase FadM